MTSNGLRRRFATEFKEQAAPRLSMPEAMQAGVAQELEITSSQLKGWRLELEAAGSADAVRRQRAEAAELAELRREKASGSPTRPHRQQSNSPVSWGKVKTAGVDMPDQMMRHVWPLAWDHIILTGQHRWSNDNPRSTDNLRTLRIQRLANRLAA